MFQLNVQIINETTALGAAYLAGLAVGYWESQEEIAAQWNMDQAFTPKMAEEETKQCIYRVEKSVNATRAFK